MSMAKQGAKTAVPRLRLVEFRNDQSWSSWRLGDLVEFSSGGTPSKAEPRYWGGDIPWVSASSMYETNIADSDFKVTSLAIGNGTRLAPRGSLLVLVRGSMLFNRVPMGVAVIDVAFNQDVKALKIGSGINARFLLNQLIAISPRIPINETGIGAGKIETETLANLSIYLPSGAEQQKIADCLTSLDEVIAAQGRKVEALKAHKRGLMQQLFPREGETRPRLRFPEFRDAPEWREAALGPLTSKVGSGITPRGGDANYKAKGRPFVRSQNVGWGLLLLDDIAFIDESTHASFLGTEIVASDVLLNITGASIGRSAVADERIAGGNVNQHVCIIRAKRDELDPVLLNQFLISERGQEQIDSFQAGGNRQGLNFAQIRSFQIPLPPTIDEQQCIADCLSSLDTRIAAETHQLTALKTHKQCLMQQLFPVVESVAA